MMNNGRKILCGLGLLGAVVISGCGGTNTTGAPRSTTRPDHNLVQVIRAAGTASASAVEVQPLRDPAVDGFLKQAADLETAGKFVDAIGAIDRALKLAPDAPEIMQQKAELAIALARYAEAEALARRSYDLGPKLGSLCARNWQTVIETRRIAADTPSMESAKAQLAACRVPPRVRM